MVAPALRNLALLFLLSLAPVSSFAATCSPSSLTAPTGLTVQIQENCSVLVGDSRMLDARGYLFTADAELRVILISSGNVALPFSQGSRSYYLFPRRFTPPKILANDSSTLAIQTPTGLKAVFSHATKELLSLTGFEVTINPSLSISRETEGGVVVKPKRDALLLDTGWAPFPFGILVDPSREFQLVEWTDGSGHTCRSLYFELFSPTLLTDTHAFRYIDDPTLDRYLSDACPELGWTDSPSP